MSTLVTLGLGRRSTPAFVGLLEQIEADVCVDVRLLRDHANENFAEFRIAGVVEESGTPYLHRDGLAEVTVPVGQRRLKDERELTMLAHALRQGKKVVLLCGCESEIGCHRGQIVKAMEERVDGLTVQRL